VVRDLRFSTLVANAKAAAVIGMLDGGWVLIFDGQRPPSAAQDPEGCTLLAKIQFGAPAFDPPARGKAEARPFRPCLGEVFGTPTWFRVMTARGDAAFDGSVGPTNAHRGQGTWSEELDYDMTVDGDIHEGGDVEVKSFVYVEPLR
jgi:hypothetical protein